MNRYTSQILFTYINDYNEQVYTYLLTIDGKTKETIIYETSKWCTRTELFEQILNELYLYTVHVHDLQAYKEDAYLKQLSSIHTQFTRCLGEQFLTTYRLEDIV